MTNRHEKLSLPALAVIGSLLSFVAGGIGAAITYGVAVGSRTEQIKELQRRADRVEQRLDYEFGKP